ncbi:MAG: glycosyltransferase [Pseudomonadota bacterium]
MTRWLGVFRKDRVVQFFRVLRRNGLREAMRRARVHIRALALGVEPSAVSQPAGPAPIANRFDFAPVWRDLAQVQAFGISQAPAVLMQRRAVALIGDLNLPQCRKYRVEQMDELLATEDIAYQYAHFEDVPRCREILQDATHLVLYRLGRSDLATMYLYEARRLRLPVLYDIDDPLFSVSAYETYANMEGLSPQEKAHFVNEAPLYADVMNMADAVSLSTPGLMAHASCYSVRPAYLRRNFADRETLAAGAQAMSRRRRRTGPTVAVASGSRGHGADLAVIQDDLVTWLEGGSDRNVVLLGHLDRDGFPDSVRPQVSVTPFTRYSTYLGHLASADAAIVPLADDPFNRCKSSVRAIDAAAAGVPVLVSNVGDLNAVVRDGETGLVVPEGGWGSALAHVLDQATMEQMGRNARANIERRWSAHAAPPIVDPGLLRWVAA